MSSRQGVPVTKVSRDGTSPTRFMSHGSEMCTVVGCMYLIISRTSFEGTSSACSSNDSKLSQINRRNLPSFDHCIPFHGSEGARGARDSQQNRSSNSGTTEIKPLIASNIGSMKEVSKSLEKYGISRHTL